MFPRIYDMDAIITNDIIKTSTMTHNMTANNDITNNSTVTNQQQQSTSTSTTNLCCINNNKLQTLKQRKFELEKVLQEKKQILLQISRDEQQILKSKKKINNTEPQQQPEQTLRRKMDISYDVSQLILPNNVNDKTDDINKLLLEKQIQIQISETSLKFSHDYRQTKSIRRTNKNNYELAQQKIRSIEQDIDILQKINDNTLFGTQLPLSYSNTLSSTLSIQDDMKERQLIKHTTDDINIKETNFMFNDNNNINFDKKVMITNNNNNSANINQNSNNNNVLNSPRQQPKYNNNNNNNLNQRVRHNSFSNDFNLNNNNTSGCKLITSNYYPNNNININTNYNREQPQLNYDINNHTTLFSNNLNLTKIKKTTDFNEYNNDLLRLSNIDKGVNRSNSNTMNRNNIIYTTNNDDNNITDEIMASLQMQQLQQQQQIQLQLHQHQQQQLLIQQRKQDELYFNKANDNYKLYSTSPSSIYNHNMELYNNHFKENQRIKGQDMITNGITEQLLIPVQRQQQPQQQQSQQQLQPQQHGLGGYWATLDNNERIWCSIDSRFCSLDRKQNQQHLTTVKKNQLLSTSSSSCSPQPTKSSSLGNFEFITKQQDEISDSISISSVNSESKKLREKIWCETSLDSPVIKYKQTQNVHNPLLLSPTLISPTSSGGTIGINHNLKRYSPSSPTFSATSATGTINTNNYLYNNNTNNNNNNNNHHHHHHHHHHHDTLPQINNNNDNSGQYYRDKNKLSSHSMSLPNRNLIYTNNDNQQLKEAISVNPYLINTNNNNNNIIDDNYTTYYHQPNYYDAKISPQLSPTYNQNNNYQTISTTNKIPLKNITQQTSANYSSLSIQQKPKNFHHPINKQDIRIESPKNMKIIQQAKFLPYKEVTKPFEMSDFYKYSTKFRQKNTASATTTSSTLEQTRLIIGNDNDIGGGVNSCVNINDNDDSQINIQKVNYQPPNPFVCEPINYDELQ